LLFVCTQQCHCPLHLLFFFFHHDINSDLFVCLLFLLAISYSPLYFSWSPHWQSLIPWQISCLGDQQKLSTSYVTCKDNPREKCMATYYFLRRIPRTRFWYANEKVWTMFKTPNKVWWNYTCYCHCNRTQDFGKKLFGLKLEIILSFVLSEATLMHHIKVLEFSYWAEIIHHSYVYIFKACILNGDVHWILGHLVYF